jgi:hypothetical protein
MPRCPTASCRAQPKLGLRPFWGDIHNHSDLSYGHGSFHDALKKAALQLDFVSITGHAHWPDMPVDDPSVAHIVDFHIKGFEKLRRAWPGHFEVLRAANEPGQFTVFAGYEIHSFADGDYTIVLADLDGGPLCLEDTPAAVKKALRAQYGDRAFAFPHHIGYRQGARGINWATFDPDLSPVVEMLSMHGCAEASEDPRGYLHSMGPVDGHSTMATGWRQGTASASSAIPTTTAASRGPTGMAAWRSMHRTTTATRSGRRSRRAGPAHKPATASTCWVRFAALCKAGRSRRRTMPRSPSKPLQAVPSTVST